MSDNQIVMAQKNVFVLDVEESPWPSFLEEFFSDTPASMQYFDEPQKAALALTKYFPDIFFLKENLLTPVLIPKIKAYKQAHPEFRIYELGVTEKPKSQVLYDMSFGEPLLFPDFQRKFGSSLPLPERIHVLIADDEAEIGAMLQGFLKGREHPTFEVEWVSNGRLALDAIQKRKPNVLVLDVKMPEMDGREVYREIIEKKMNIPVIIYFDAIFGDEILSIHRIGTPAIVERGGRESTLPDMLALIQKMVYFG